MRSSKRVRGIYFFYNIFTAIISVITHSVVSPIEVIWKFVLPHVARGILFIWYCIRFQESIHFRHSRVQFYN